MHPYLLHLGHVLIPTFGVLAAVGLMCALALGERTAHWAGVDPEELWNAGLFTVVAAFVISRLLLIALNWQTLRAFPLLALTVPSLTPSGLLLTLIATLAWLRFRRIPMLRALDAWSPCATLIWCFLALGHFAEASDPGLETSVPWAVRFPGESLGLHPVAVYAAIIAAILTILLCRRLSRPTNPGRTSAEALMTSGLAQFLLTFLRQPESEASGLDHLQWVALAMIVAGGLFLAAEPLIAPHTALPTADQGQRPGTYQPGPKT